MTAEERESLIESNLNLVRAIADRVLKSVPAYVGYDDLYSAGLEGLLSAAGVWDETKGVRFSTFAQHRVRGEMLDYLRKLDAASRTDRRRIKRIAAVREELKAKLGGQEPGDEAIAAALGCPVDELRSSMTALAQIENPLQSDERDLRGIVDTAPLPDELAGLRQMRELIDQVKAGLSERHSTILTLYYSEKLSLREIGDRLGITQGRVSQLHKRALELAREAFEAKGICGSSSFV